MTTRLALCAALGLLTVVQYPLAQENSEDDPAITVCEHVLISTLKAPKSYERVVAKVVGHEVLIQYDAVNVYNAPLRNWHTCQFELDGTGKFTLYDGEVRRQTEELQALNEEMTARPAPSAQRFAIIKARIEEMTDGLSELIMSSLAMGMAASETGLLPIDPENTTLSAETAP